MTTLAAVRPVLESLLQVLPCPAAVVGRGGQVLLANAAWRRAAPSPLAIAAREDAGAVPAVPDRQRGVTETRLPLVDDAGHLVRLIVLERRRLVRPASFDATAPALTAREREVAVLIAGGLRNDAIAERLGLSPFTVKRHTERVLKKLGVASRAGVAVRLGASGCGGGEIAGGR